MEMGGNCIPDRMECLVGRFSLGRAGEGRYDEGPVLPETVRDGPSLDAKDSDTSYTPSTGPVLFGTHEGRTRKTSHPVQYRIS